MKHCLGCGSELVFRQEDQAIAMDWSTIQRFVECDCGQTNVVVYGQPTVATSYGGED